MNYKEILKKIDQIDLIDDILFQYSSLYTLKTSNPKYYELIFNKSYDSPILIPKITDELLLDCCRFYLDDDDIILTVDKMLMLVLITRFEYFKSNIYKMIQHNLLRYDISLLFASTTNVDHFSYNNRIKIQSRIQVVKTYRIKNNEKVYFSCIGDALKDFNLPTREEDIIEYTKKFNDPIAVNNLTKGIYCHLNKPIKAVGYSSDDKSITSIFEVASNLPERLRQHCTSNYIEPCIPISDGICNNENEKIDALTVFMPVETTGDAILGKHTLLAGEILIHSHLAQSQFYVRRTFQLSSKDVNIVPIGSVVQPNDILAYDCEGYPVLTYDLNYNDAIVEDIIESWNSYKIVLKIKANLDVGRLISDYGIKGVSHPREDLGLVDLSSITGDKEDYYIPTAIVGPPSIKSGFSAIQLAWINLKQSFKEESIDINPENYTEEQINEMCSDLHKVPWYYNDKVTYVYIGMVSFGVTDLAKDCKVGPIRLSPEILKYMHLSGNIHLKNIADQLLDRYVPVNDKWLFNELSTLRKTDCSKNLIIDWDNNELQSILNKTYFHIGDKVSINKYMNQSMFLFSPLNRGFTIKFEDVYVNIPSYQVINQMTYCAMGNAYYPKFIVYLMLFLLSLKLYYNKKCNKDKVYENIKKYILAIEKEIFPKKKALPNLCSPIVYGGHLKQIVSTYVPQGIVVIMDKNFESKINLFYKQYRKPIYDIGSRNPILWSFQFMPRKIWTFSKFKSYLEHKKININDVIRNDMNDGIVIRNVIDIMYDKADADGDLYPVSVVLDESIQDSLNQYINDPIVLKTYEKEWINQYIQKELAKNKKLENPVPFKYHTILREDFANLLAYSAIAKGKVGIATIELWQFHLAAEIFMYKGVISKEEMDLFQFTFSRIVQDTVVEGIKHVEGGASGYDVYSLKNIEDNQEIVRQLLVDCFNFTTDNANTYVECCFYAKEKHIKILSRLPHGGMSSRMSDGLKDLTHDDIKYLTAYTVMLNGQIDKLIQIKTDSFNHISVDLCEMAEY